MQKCAYFLSNENFVGAKGEERFWQFHRMMQTNQQLSFGEKLLFTEIQFSQE
jgi:hypothetical protein